jgi:hypothetical protein
MRHRFRQALLLCLLFSLWGNFRLANAAVVVEKAAFYDRLAPYGSWFQHPRHGWVWHPSVVEVGWRPYTHGHWVATEEYGWMWDSDYEWGWAPFHYGRWGFDADSGWFWVPGDEWGPAWVAWRSGDGYIGWAPLPPEVGWDAGVGLQWGSFNLDLAWFRPSWVFTEERFFLAPRLEHVILEPARNVTLVERTRNVTRYVTEDRRIVNRSVSVERIEEIARTHVERVHVNEVNNPTSTFGARARAGWVNVFRPSLKQSSGALAPPKAGDLNRIRAAEHSALEERHQVEKERLEQRHQSEREESGIAADQLRRQQEAERQAMTERHRGEERVLQHWQRQNSAGRPHGHR